MTFRCRHCEVPFASPFHHPTLGTVCPVCLKPCGRTVHRPDPLRTVRVQAKDRVVGMQTNGFVKCSRCAALFRFAVEDRVWGLSCPICFLPLTRATKKKYRRASRKTNPLPPMSDIYEEFIRSDPGNPLGHGMPLGRTLRKDGESHREAWMRTLRWDPCAYCCALPVEILGPLPQKNKDGRVRGTLDHIEPQSRTARGIGGKHTWLNYVGACEHCNSKKAAVSLLEFLGRRAGMQFPQKNDLRQAA